MIYYFTVDSPALMSYPLFPDKLAVGQAEGSSRLMKLDKELPGEYINQRLML